MKCAGALAAGKMVADRTGSIMVVERAAESPQELCRRKVTKNRLFVDMVDFLKICSLIFKFLQIGF